MDFRRALILAPMVRANTVAFRLLCLEYGADIVYSQEVVDHSLLQCTRTENLELGTIEFANKSGGVIFRTVAVEKQKVVFQLGTSSPSRALAALKMIEKDVAGVDINMGCPKHFSVSGGMGAALLSDPERAKKILVTLVKNATIPITCKIRILPGCVQNTINFVEGIISTGISAITIHGRTRYERPSDPCNEEYLRQICSAFNNKIPVIVNGGSLEISTYHDIINFANYCGTAGVMIARAALRNPSIFQETGTVPVMEVFTKYVALCTRYGVEFSLFKYILNVMISRSSTLDALFEASTYQDVWYSRLNSKAFF